MDMIVLSPQPTGEIASGIPVRILNVFAPSTVFWILYFALLIAYPNSSFTISRFRILPPKSVVVVAILSVKLIFNIFPLFVPIQM